MRRLRTPLVCPRSYRVCRKASSSSPRATTSEPVRHTVHGVSTQQYTCSTPVVEKVHGVGVQISMHGVLERACELVAEVEVVVERREHLVALPAELGAHLPYEGKAR